MLAGFLLGMLGSLSANLITRPTEKLIQNVEQKNADSSALLGTNKTAIVVASLIIAGSVLYLYKKK